MRYFPKSQIIANKYTGGEELQYKKAKKPYIGYYYETSDGKKFTGKNPTNGSNLELEPITDPANEIPPTLNIGPLSTIQGNSGYSIDAMYPLVNSPIVGEYLRNKQIGFDEYAKTLPFPTQPIPNELDIKTGEYTRYFCKKNNEPEIFEISQEIYFLIKTKNKKILYQLYSVLQLQWKLTGDNIESINQKVVAKAEKDNKWYGFTNYFKNNFGSPI